MYKQDVIVRPEAQLVDPRAASCLSSSLSGDAVASRYTENICVTASSFGDLKKLADMLSRSGAEKAMLRALVIQICWLEIVMSVNSCACVA